MTANDRGTDSKHVNQNKLTVDLQQFVCEYCVETRQKRVSYEDGRWVHYTCGMPVPKDVSERADKRLQNGEGEYSYPQKEAEAIAEVVADTFKMAEGEDDGR